MFKYISVDPDGKYFVPTGWHCHPHCVHKPLQFYSWLVCWSTMLHMSVSTQSHLQCFVIALIDLKIHVISVVHFQDNQEFNPTASFLWKSISGTFHLNFILQNSWHHCCKVLERSDLALVMTTTSLHNPTNSWSMILFSLQGPERSDKH